MKAVTGPRTPKFVEAYRQGEMLLSVCRDCLGNSRTRGESLWQTDYASRKQPQPYKSR